MVIVKYIFITSQRTLKVVMPCLVVIFWNSLKLSYILGECREVRIVLIPKNEKINHITATNYRSISLFSFLLEESSGRKISYQKGKSVETAFHDVVGIIENTPKRKELASFLGIENALKNENTFNTTDEL